MGTKFVVAAFLGGYVGGLVAYSVRPMLWLVGVIVGGIVGYLSYDFKTVLRTFLPFLPAISRFLKGLSWLAVGTAKKFPAAFVVLSNLWVPAFVLIVLADSLLEGGSLALGALLFFSVMLAGSAVLDEECGEQTMLPKEPFHYNPFTIYLYYLPKGLWWMTIRAPRGVVLLILFLARGFVTIHSEMRLLVLVDSAVGVTIGYLLNYPPVLCGVVAVMVGLINREVIARRVFHLSPR